jgi:hypothetical protein
MYRFKIHEILSSLNMNIYKSEVYKISPKKDRARQPASGPHIRYAVAS